METLEIETGQQVDAYVNGKWQRARVEAVDSTFCTVQIGRAQHLIPRVNCRAA